MNTVRFLSAKPAKTLSVSEGASAETIGARSCSIRVIVLDHIVEIDPGLDEVLQSVLVLSREGSSSSLADIAKSEIVPTLVILMFRDVIKGEEGDADILIAATELVTAVHLGEFVGEKKYLSELDDVMTRTEL